MQVLLYVLIILVSLLLIGVVLIQNSKGGGLDSSFSQSNQLMGVRRTTEIIEKITWGLGGALLVLSILATATVDRSDATQSGSVLMEQVKTVPDPNSRPIMPEVGTPSNNTNGGNTQGNQ